MFTNLLSWAIVPYSPFTASRLTMRSLCASGNEVRFRIFLQDFAPPYQPRVTPLHL